MFSSHVWVVNSGCASFLEGLAVAKPLMEEGRLHSHDGSSGKV